MLKEAVLRTGCLAGVTAAAGRSDEQELSVLCLRVLQAALVYVNTLMVQDVLADEEWVAQLTDADRRGLTPLFWTHVAPYGEVKLDMSSRLQLSAPMPST
ncbi:MAG: transposase [Microlunatus sp.]|nr:transposase [Microlunatus sp.]MDN5770853.1 transposase [Microlunatus sp.]